MAPEHQPRAALPGTRPPGAADEAAAARQVREMFSGIAPRYDLLNHVLSLRFDVAWRKRLARRFATLLAAPGVRVLDLCCGTGDLTLALAAKRPGRQHPVTPSGTTSAAASIDIAKVVATGPQILGADFAHPMLIQAQIKARKTPGTGIEFLEADALSLPFAAESFDLVTTAFGFRNLANYKDGLVELRRVLRPGGSVAILEFTEPKAALFGALFRFYFRRVLPKIGGIVSSNSQAYGYLPDSVARFPGLMELAELMRGAGFGEVAFERWTGGIVALHTAKR